MVSFAKRGTTTPANPSPAHHPVTQADLREQISNIRAQIENLARSRAELALPAIGGNASAQTSIEKIDVQRQELVARQETLEAAYRTLQHQAREQASNDVLTGKRATFQRNKQNLCKTLAQQVRHQYESLAWHLDLLQRERRHEEIDAHWLGTSLPGQPGNESGKPPGAKNVARMTALELVSGLCRVRTGSPGTVYGSPGTIYRDTTDQALADEFVAALLAEAKLPECPSDLKSFVARWGKGSDQQLLPSARVVPTAEPGDDGHRVA